MVKHYVHQLYNGFQWKTILSVVGAVITAIEGFYTNLLWGFLSLFILDLITGIMKSKKKGVPITSDRLRQSVTKLGAYMMLITSVIIAGKYETSFKSIVSAVYYYFMFTELKSIKENVEEMGIYIPNFLSGKINSKCKSYLDSEDEKKDKDDLIKKLKEEVECLRKEESNKEKG